MKTANQFLKEIDNVLTTQKDKDLKNKYRLKYHLMPTVGFMNDPNGLCELKGIYHIYYQYSPLTPLGGQKFWGHYTTTDFITFKDEPIAVFPDTIYDNDGVYSGCAFVEYQNIDFFYTGNVRQDGDFDYVYNGREQNTLHFSSKDGYTMSDKQLLMTNKDYPKDMSCHVRDPKVWKENDTYYMVLGARTIKDKGEVLIYNSSDKKNWFYINRISTDKKFGFMWECPDIFKLNGKTILSICPQGVEASGIEYNNEHQSGYMILDGDWKTSNYNLSKFIEYDRGFDFYAPQSFVDNRGRRIMIGWIGLPTAEYSNQPTIDEGWQHCLTIPRELILKDGKIYQKPLSELKNMRKEKHIFHINQNYKISHKDNVFEMVIKFSEPTSDFALKFREDMLIEYKNELFSITLGKSGYGRANRTFRIKSFEEIRIFSDTSVIEIFVGGECFTTKIFEKGCTFEMLFTSLKQKCTVTLYELTGYQYK